MYNLRSESAASPVSFTGPHLQEDHDSTAETSITLSPPVLLPQVTSSEAMRILASQDTVSDTVADTMLSLGAESQAANTAPQTFTRPPPFNGT